MTEQPAQSEFRRTLPLFDDQDRDVVQRLLHHAVADYDYDHPDRKVARDLYHDIREGKAIRLLISPEINNKTLVIAPIEVGANPVAIVERFVNDMRSRPGEWRTIATALEDWREHAELVGDDLQIAFEYLH